MWDVIVFVFKHGDSWLIPPTLGLHAGADQRQRVARQLSTCAGDSAAANEDHHPRISQTRIPVQPRELQGLWKRIKDGKQSVRF